MGQKCNLRITFTFPRVWKSVKDWIHTIPSGFPFCEFESLWNLEFFKNNLKGKKFIVLNTYLYYWTSFKVQMSSNDPFEYLQHKWWSKERLVEAFFWLIHALPTPWGSQMCVPNRKHRKNKESGHTPWFVALWKGRGAC